MAEATLAAVRPERARRCAYCRERQAEAAPSRRSAALGPSRQPPSAVVATVALVAANEQYLLATDRFEGHG
jgi:hypothetical protein